MKGYYVTLSMLGLFTLLLALTSQLETYGQRMETLAYHENTMNKIAWAQKDVSQALSSIYAVGISSAANETIENITISQGIPGNPSAALDYSDFLSGKFSDLEALGISLSPQPAGMVVVAGPQGIAYSLNESSNYSQVASPSGVTGISAMSIQVNSSADLNQSGTLPFVPSGDLPVAIVLKTPSKNISLIGNVNSLVQNSVLFSSSADPSRFINITVGAIDGSSPSASIRLNNTFATWSYSFSIPVNGETLSEWHFPDMLSITAPGYGYRSNVSVGVRELQ